MKWACEEQCLPECGGDIEAQMFFFAFVTALNMDPILSPQTQVFQRKRERTSYWRYRKLNTIHQIRERIAWHHWGIFVTAVNFSQVRYLGGGSLKYSRNKIG